MPLVYSRYSHCGPLHSWHSFQLAKRMCAVAKEKAHDLETTARMSRIGPWRQRDSDTVANMIYGFDAQGGFYVIDHARRRATYAYPSSNHAEMAKTRPGYVVARMVEEHDDPATPSIHESHYLAVCRSVEGAR